jgi:hypothetical protein
MIAMPQQSPQTVVNCTQIAFSRDGPSHQKILFHRRTHSAINENRYAKRSHSRGSPSNPEYLLKRHAGGVRRTSGRPLPDCHLAGPQRNANSGHQLRHQAQKVTFYKQLVSELHDQLDIAPSDIMINLTVNTDADWSLGLGRAQFLTGEL